MHDKGTATLVKQHSKRESNSSVTFGAAALYRLSKPYQYDDEKPPCEYMFVSTSCVLGTWETYAFPAVESGDCLSWGELPGSEKETRSHATVLGNMGYELVVPS